MDLTATYALSLDDLEDDQIITDEGVADVLDGNTLGDMPSAIEDLERQDVLNADDSTIARE